jgi:hypothetical protein
MINRYFMDWGDTRINGRHIIETAKTYIGVPFRHQGRDRQGIDCIGLLIAVGYEYGYFTKVQVPELYDTYGVVFNGRKFLGAIERILVPVKGKWQDGDVIMFASEHTASYDRSRVRHCGFLTWEKDNPYIIHAYRPQRAVVMNRVDVEWMRVIHRVYRVPGL